MQPTIGSSEAAPALSSTAAKSAVRYWLYGGLLVALLDMIDAVVFYRATPFAVCRSIAGALIGVPLMRSGAPWVEPLGALMHVTVATSIVGVYFLLGRRWPALHRRAVAAGLLYGVVAFFVMQWAIVPLMVHRGPSTAPAELANGILGHAFLVGLPAALFARRSARRDGNR